VNLPVAPARPDAGGRQAGPPASTGRPRPRLRGTGALGARSVALAGLALAVLVLLLALGLMGYERREHLRDERVATALMARVLEDHATRSVDTAALALAALAELVAKSELRADTQLGWVLAQSLAGLPVLREVAVIDGQGLVLASTDPGNQDRVLDLARLGPLPQAGAEALGSFVRGRGLGALTLGAAAAAAPPGVGFVPLVRHVRTQSNRALLLVGLINPDAVANHQQQMLGERGSSAVLASFSGQVLAATAGPGALPGGSVQTLPVFTEYLPRIEHGSFVGTGSRPGEQILAFRASRTRPLVVIVETPVELALAEWKRNLGAVALAAALLALVIVLLSQLAARSLRSRETARRQRDEAQAEVASRERELSVIVKSVQELLFRTDAEGRLTFVNARWQAASGHTEALALGQALPSLVRPASAAAAQQLFADGAADGLRTAELMMGTDASERHFDVAVAPLRAHGRIVGFAGSAVDVTAQRTAQGRLRAQLALTELLLDVLPVPLAILDTQGCYTSVNQAWQEFSGRQRHEVVGRPARSFRTPAEALEHDRHDAELLARGGRTRYEARVTHHDGSTRDLAITKAAVPGPDGQVTGILVAFTDVTEFREAERATREARDAAEETSRAKTEFIGNISHELRTPLQSIIGFSELGQARSGEARRLGSMFGDIHAAGQRMLALVNDLLDVAKIESTVGTFHLERIDIRSLVRDVADELAPLLGAKQIRLDLQLSPAPLEAKVDPLRFQQVVRNVMANAIRFSPPGLPLQVVGDVDEDQHIRVSVHDRGPGIPPAELEQIFEAFVQSSKTKDGSGGTGLGLAISRKILQAHGGTIRAENKPGGGATFHIVVPARGFSPTLAQA